MAERPFPAEPTAKERAMMERMKRAKPDIVVMHPGPINRGLEMESEDADGSNSVILRQVTNGLAVRMAVLFLVNQAAAEAIG